MTDTFALARQRLVSWRENPALMVRELFGATPDKWQEKALRLFPSQEKQREALQACAGPGKSTVLAWCGWNFLLCYAEPDQHPNGAALSIDAQNLKDNLWKELALWYGRSELLQREFEITTERIFHRKYPKTWFLSARSYAKTANTEAQGRTLSGLHSPFMLYLLDETGDINPAVLRSAEQGLGNCRWGKILIAGNPTSQDGVLHLAVTQQSHLWDVIRITGDPDDPQRSTRISPEWAREQIAVYGRNNPWVMAYILGLFPPGSLNTLLGVDEVRAAIGRGLREDQFSFAQKRIGLDPARFGDDRTMFAPRQGLLAGPSSEMRGARTNEIAARLANMKRDYGSEMEFIDSTGGYGAGVEDSLLLAGITIVPVNFSGKPDDRRYFNKRSEMHFLAAEWVKRGGALPNEPMIVREATAARYWFEGGKMRVEEKEQIKKRLGFSPDYWDAFITTFAMPDMPAGMMELVGVGGRGKFESDYDPYPSEQ